MKLEHSAGCVAFKLAVEGTLLAFMLDRFGQWTFPKGHIEEGETAFAAARRELAEELGLTGVELFTRLGQSSHRFTDQGDQIEKQTEWFLVKAAPEAVLRAAEAEQVKGTAWLSPSQAKARLGYGNLRMMLRLARSIILSCCP